jgi:3-oxoacyl-[acyl-carrier-protein] synthase III
MAVMSYLCELKREKMNAKIHAAITGIQGFVPEDILSNQDLEKMVDTTDEWIYSRTGIKERRILKGDMKGASEMGVAAVQGLLEKTGTSPDDIELLICATVTGDYVFPDTANVICDKVGIRNAYGFDINAACSGFLFSLNVAARMIESGAHKKVIVVGLDKMSSIVDYTDRATCVIFGDGAGAVLMEPDMEGNGLLDADLHGDGSGRHYLHMKAGGSLLPASIETVQNRLHYVYQEGRTVFKYAVKGMSSSVEEVLKRNGLTKEDVSWLVPHQANMRIITSVAETLDFPLEKVMINIEKYGNTTSGTIPLCLWEWEHKLKKGDYVLLTAFGGGFTWGAILLRWAYNS